MLGRASSGQPGQAVQFDQPRPIRAPLAASGAQPVLTMFRELPNLQNGRDAEDNAYRLEVARALERLEFGYPLDDPRRCDGASRLGRRFYEDCQNVEHVRIHHCSDDPAHDLHHTACECDLPGCSECNHRRLREVVEMLTPAFDDVQNLALPDNSAKLITLTSCLSPYDDQGNVLHPFLIADQVKDFRGWMSSVWDRYHAAWCQVARWWVQGKPRYPDGRRKLRAPRARQLARWVEVCDAMPQHRWKVAWFHRNLKRLADGWRFSQFTLENPENLAHRTYWNGKRVTGKDLIGVYGGAEWGESGHRLHGHQVYNGPFICRPFLALCWKDVTGGQGLVIDVRRVDDAASALREVSKYAVKLVKDGQRLDPGLLAALMVALRGQRRVFGRGCFYRIGLEDEQQPYQCAVCGAKMTSDDLFTMKHLACQNAALRAKLESTLPDGLLILLDLKLSDKSKSKNPPESDKPDPPPPKPPPRQSGLPGFDPAHSHDYPF